MAMTLDADKPEANAAPTPTPTPAPPAPTPPSGRPRQRCDVLGLDLLPDGRVVAVGLSRAGRGRAVRTFVHVAASAAELAGDLAAGRIVARRTNLALPRPKVVTKNLRLPSVRPDEVRTMIDFESAGLMPLAEGRNVRAFVGASDPAAGYTEVSLFVTPDTVVEDYLAPLGRPVDRVVASPVALLAWARVLGPSSQPRILLTADRWSLDAVTLRGGCLGYCRTMPRAGGDLIGQAMIEQAAESLAQAQAHAEGGGDVLLIAPAEEGLQLVCRLCLRSGTPEQPAVLRWVSGLGQTGEEPGGAIATGELAAAVARAGGAAAVDFAPELGGFNLLAARLVASQRRRGLRRQVGRAAVLAGLLIGLLAATLKIQAHQRADQIDHLEAQLEPIRATAQGVSEKREQLMLLQSQLAGRGQPLAVLAELYAITPKGIQLVEIKLNGRELTITGQAQTAGQAYQFPAVLMRSRLFDRVQFGGATPVTRPGGVVTEFSCTCQVVPPASAEGKR